MKSNSYRGRWCQVLWGLVGDYKDLGSHSKGGVEGQGRFSAEERCDLTIILIGSLLETKTATLSLSEQNIGLFEDVVRIVVRMYFSAGRKICP